MQVPEVDTAVRSLTVMWDGSLVVAANNHGTCYVWRLLRGTQVVSLYIWHKCYPFYPVSYITHFPLWNLPFMQTMTNFEPLHKLQAHKGYILKCLLSPEFCEPHRLYRLIICQVFPFVPQLDKFQPSSASSVQRLHQL